MPEAELFQCPSCGSALSPQGSAAEIKCQFCGNTVIVPEGLRRTLPDQIVSRSALSSARSQSTGIPGMLVGLGILVVVGIIALVLFGSLLGGSSVGPVGFKPAATSTPVGFAHVVLSFGGQGTGPGLFQEARHVAVDSNGNFYADDNKTMRVQRFDSTGKYVSSWMVDQKFCSNKSAPLNTLAADRNGNVYVEWCGHVLKYDGASGKLLADLNGDKDKPSEFYMGMALYPDGGLLIVADGAPAAHEVLLHLDVNGQVLARYPNLVTNQSSKEASAGSLDPAVDGLGNIFLLKEDESAIYKFTPDGKYVNKFGSVGTAASQFNTRGLLIAVDNQSRIYTTDFGGIKVFDSNGTFLESMKDNFAKGIDEMRISDKNEILIVSSDNMIYKLARNTP